MLSRCLLRSAFLRPRLAPTAAAGIGATATASAAFHAKPARADQSEAGITGPTTATPNRPQWQQDEAENSDSSKQVTHSSPRRHSLSSSDSPFDLFGPVAASGLTVPSLMRDFFADPFFRHALAPVEDIGGRIMGQMFDFEKELKRDVRIDLQETENEYVMKVVAPTFKKEDLNVRVDENVLTVSGEESEESQDDKGGRRSSRRSFTRSTRLPPHVDGTKIVAKFEDNTLRVILPKSKVDHEKRGVIAIQ